MERIFGYEWSHIKRAQQGESISEPVDVNKSGDYGADPLGNGKFRMVPSGDIVDFTERNERLAK